MNSQITCKKYIEMVTETKQNHNIETLKKQFLPVFKQHQVAKAGIFGSTAEGTARKTSDIDLLIEFKGVKSLFDLVALKLDLEATISTKIDVTTYKALNPLIRKKVLAQEVRIL